MHLHLYCLSSCHPCLSYRQCNSPLLPHLSSIIFHNMCCYDKLPQTRWLKTKEMCFLTVMESISPKLRCWQGYSPSEGSKEESFLVLSASGSYQQFLLFLGLQMHHSNPCLILHMVFISAFRFPSSYKDSSYTRLGPTLI